MIVGTEVSFPGLGITIDVNPVAFSIGSFKVYWYGIFIACAILLCIGLALKHSKAHNFPDGLVYDTMLVSIPCAIVGARLYYVFCNWSYYSSDLSRIIDTRSGGLAIYGGIIGAFLGSIIMCLIRKIPFTSLADYCIVYIPLGQAIGRWGNFFNQEAFGTNSNLPWGMTSATVQSYIASNCPSLIATAPVHPTFLYESIADLIIFFLLILVRKRSKHAFETTAVYFACYGLARFFIEGLRTDSLYIGSTDIRISQMLSFVLLVVSLVYISVAHISDLERKPFPARLYEVATPAEVKATEVEATEVEAAEVTTSEVTSSEVKAADTTSETVESEVESESDSAKDDANE